MNERASQVLLVTVGVLLLANLFLTMTASRRAHADDAGKTHAVLRARAIELVDKQGRTVAQLHVGEDGGGNLRLRSGEGTIRVKLGATAGGSGLLLLDRDAEPAVWLAADQTGTRITLAEKGKEKRVIKP